MIISQVISALKTTKNYFTCIVKSKLYGFFDKFYKIYLLKHQMIKLFNISADIAEKF